MRRQDGGGEVAEEGERCGFVAAAAAAAGGGGGEREGDVEMVGREEGGARRQERREECGKGRGGVFRAEGMEGVEDEEGFWRNHYFNYS